ncbi:MAG: hypothetical protein AAF612_08675 [Planctomycetota bacterium]
MTAATESPARAEATRRTAMDNAPNPQPEPNTAPPGSIGAGASWVEPGAHPEELVLVKDGQRYAFVCPTGREADLIDRLAQAADRPEAGLTWFEAALVADHLGQRWSGRLEQRRAGAEPLRRSA